MERHTQVPTDRSLSHREIQELDGNCEVSAEIFICQKKYKDKLIGVKTISLNPLFHANNHFKSRFLCRLITLNKQHSAVLLCMKQACSL